MALYSDPTITGVATENENQHHGAYLGYIAALLSCLVAIFFFVMTQTNKSENKKLATQISAEQTTVDSYSGIKDQLSFYDTSVKDFNSIFSSQVQWGAVLNQFASGLYKGVKITSLQFNSDGTATLSGKLKNYTDYGKFYKSMTDVSSAAYFSDVKVNSVTRASDLETKEGAPAASEEVTFAYTLKLSPTLLKLDDFTYKSNYLTALIAKDNAALAGASASQAEQKKLTDRVYGMQNEQKRLSVESYKQQIEALKAKVVALEADNSKLASDLYQDSYSASRISQNTEAIRTTESQISNLQNRVDTESKNLK